ncbi:MAG: hypothetical protein R2699_13160 [Acidimicrobiales bacterium]
MIAAALLLRTGDAAVETADPSTSSTTVESSTTSSVRGVDDDRPRSDDHDDAAVG